MGSQEDPPEPFLSPKSSDSQLKISESSMMFETKGQTTQAHDSAYVESVSSNKDELLAHREAPISSSLPNESVSQAKKVVLSKFDTSVATESDVIHSGASLSKEELLEAIRNLPQNGQSIAKAYGTTKQEIMFDVIRKTEGDSGNLAASKETVSASVDGLKSTILSAVAMDENTPNIPSEPVNKVISPVVDLKEAM